MGSLGGDAYVDVETEDGVFSPRALEAGDLCRQFALRRVLPWRCSGTGLISGWLGFLALI